MGWGVGGGSASRPLPPADYGSFGAPARHGLTGAALPFFISLGWWCLAPVQFSYLSNRRSEAHEAAIDVNPRLIGGGGFWPLSFFLDISRSYKGIIAKFSAPSK